MLHLPSLQGQNPLFKPGECGETPSPRLWLKGEVFQHPCDSLWIITPARLQLYEEAVQLILAWDTTRLFAELSGLEKSLHQITSSGRQMQSDYDALEEAYRKTLDKQESQIQGLRQALSEVRDGIDAERQRSASIASELRIAQKQQHRRSIIWGGSGFALGVLATFLITH
jgi:hypothetical protein